MIRISLLLATDTCTEQLTTLSQNLSNDHQYALISCVATAVTLHVRMHVEVLLQI